LSQIKSLNPKQNINVELHDVLNTAAGTEGAMLATYAFDHLKSTENQGGSIKLESKNLSPTALEGFIAAKGILRMTFRAKLGKATDGNTGKFAYTYSFR
jgi:hypothetical protein